MVAVRSEGPYATAPAPDEQRMLLPNVAWKEYVLLRDVLDGPGIRMTYVQGVLELMSPSREHEMWKKNLARLVELYAYRDGIDLRGYGSTTFRREAKDRGAEPDECYVVGKPLGDVPDFVIEVIHSSPLLDKLGVYAALAIPEVWIFRDGRLSVHRLDASSSAYAVQPRSAFLPGLDLALVERFVLREDTNAALRELEAALAKT